jgi:hypothetical protein
MMQKAASKLTEILCSWMVGRGAIGHPNTSKGCLVGVWNNIRSGVAEIVISLRLLRRIVQLDIQHSYGKEKLVTYRNNKLCLCW